MGEPADLGKAQKIYEEIALKNVAIKKLLEAKKFEKACYLIKLALEEYGNNTKVFISAADRLTTSGLPDKSAFLKKWPTQLQNYLDLIELNLQAEKTSPFRP